MPAVGPAVPTTFGKYYLTEKLATGGMAELYLAKIIGPNGFEKPLVIKQIHPQLTGQRHFVDMFVAEAKTLVTLAHGNIVPVYELGVVDDIYFIAMDYIDGPTLHRLTEVMAHRGVRMDPALAAWIAARILDGLDYAHRKGDGVIHRDLSPRNVMLSRDGEVKLVDFGIAVALGDVETTAAAHDAPTGSFPYMSPEQVRRETLSPQTDLFSVGVVLWEMLVGRRLFARSDADATLAAVLADPIAAPSQEQAGIPHRLDELVMRALARDRHARWASASDMLAALNKLLYSLDHTPGPRDVAALVAAYCPPTTRRLSTDIEALGADRSGPVTATAGTPHTAVIPRDGAAAKGKQAQRQQTFATHVALNDMLRRAGTHGEALDRDDAAQASARLAALRRPPGTSLLIGAGAVVFALSAAAVYAFYQRRDDVLASTPRSDARTAAPGDAPLIVDGAVPLADAIPTAIETPRVHRDAGLRPSRDARSASKRPDATGRDTPPLGRGSDAGATATLTVGANPWGDVYLDGVKLPQHAPSDFAITPGRHRVRVVFPAESPPLEKICTIEIAAGETKRCDADFTR